MLYNLLSCGRIHVHVHVHVTPKTSLLQFIHIMVLCTTCNNAHFYPFTVRHDWKGYAHVYLYIFQLITYMYMYIYIYYMDVLFVQLD